MRYLLLLFLFSCSQSENQELKTLFVADKLVECTGVGKQQCMLVRESAEEEWAYFYQQIEGFNYEPGFYYELKVAVSEVKDPPADASGLHYALKEIVSKTPAPVGNDLLGAWKVIEIEGLEEIKIHPTMIFDEEEKRLGGFAGCNQYFASFEVSGSELSIGQSGATRMMCPDMTVEDAFLARLEKIAAYKVMNGELHLFDESDNRIFLAAAEK